MFDSYYFPSLDTVPFRAQLPFTQRGSLLPLLLLLVCVCVSNYCLLAEINHLQILLNMNFFFVYFISDNMKLYFFPSACPSIKQCPSTFSTYRNSLFKRCSKFYFPLRCYFVLASFCREKNLVTMGIADYMCVYVRACACMCACVSHWCKYNVDVYAFILLQIQ